MGRMPVRLWRGSTGVVRKTLVIFLRVWHVCACRSRNLLASASRDQTMWVYDIRSIKTSVNQWWNRNRLWVNICRLWVVIRGVNRLCPRVGNVVRRKGPSIWRAICEPHESIHCDVESASFVHWYVISRVLPGRYLLHKICTAWYKVMTRYEH